jgi:signal transduction histidine kinase
LTRIIEKRLSLHKNLANQQQQNDALLSQLTGLQALANIGTTTCMVAHEINNLLTPLANFAALALKNPDDKPLSEKALQKVVRNCEHASEIMESMLAVANGKRQEKQNTPLSELVKNVFTCLCRDFAKDSIAVNIQIPKDLTVFAVPIQLQQVLMNLILNARDAMLPRGGILTIKAMEDVDSIQIELSDTGRGIAPADLGKIFQPFFTTKANGKSASQHCGSGLGLAFVKRVIDDHNGCIFVESKPAEGTIFKITLPKPPA